MIRVLRAIRTAILKSLVFLATIPIQAALGQGARWTADDTDFADWSEFSSAASAVYQNNFGCGFAALRPLR